MLLPILLNDDCVRYDFFIYLHILKKYTKIFILIKGENIFMAFYSFDDFGKREEEINYNNPNCENCNDCCTMMANITEAEFNQIVKEIDSNKELRDFLICQILKNINKYLLEKTLDWTCVFSDHKKKCKIHNIAPSICKEYHCISGKKIDKTKYVNKFIIIYDVFRYVLDNYARSGINYMHCDVIDMAYHLSFDKYVDNISKSIFNEE
jgi:Fe-S-cluster containining protein